MPAQHQSYTSKVHALYHHIADVYEYIICIETKRLQCGANRVQAHHTHTGQIQRKGKTNTRQVYHRGITAPVRTGKVPAPAHDQMCSQASGPKAGATWRRNLAGRGRAPPTLPRHLGRLDKERVTTQNPSKLGRRARLGHGPTCATESSTTVHAFGPLSRHRPPRPLSLARGRAVVVDAVGDVAPSCVDHNLLFGPKAHEQGISPKTRLCPRGLPKTRSARTIAVSRASAALRI